MTARGSPGAAHHKTPRSEPGLTNYSNHKHPFARCGFAALEDLKTQECKSLLTYLESHQSDFQSHVRHSPEYIWSRDPLRTWSRVWEYPYVLYHLSELRTRLTNSERPTAIDFGCGVTFFPFAAASLGFRVICVDNEPLCERDLSDVIDKMPHCAASVVSCRTVDGTSLPFESGTIDVVYSISVLEHLPEPASVVSELSRILTDSGILIVTFDVDMSGGELGLGPRRYSRLMERISEHFDWAAPFEPVHPLDLTNRTSPYPLLCEPGGLKGMWWAAKQLCIKPLLGMRPVPWPHLGCEGLVLAKRKKPMPG